MNNWYLLSLVALLLLGSQRFLYKVAAEKQYSSALVTAVFMLTVTCLSSAVFFTSGESVVNLTELIILSLLNSSSFAFATIAHIEALKHLPAGVTFPLTRLSLVVVIIVSIFCFGERLQPLQWLGVLLGFTVVLVLGKEAKTVVNAGRSLQKGLLFITICIFCGALASISSKLAADSTSKSGFIALSYLFGTFFSLAIEKIWGKKRVDGEVKNAIVLGLLMGVLNFFGFYAFLIALANGPLSTIALITGMHFVIAIILSAWFFREKWTARGCFGIGLTLLAVALLR